MLNVTACNEYIFSIFLQTAKNFPPAILNEIASKVLSAYNNHVTPSDQNNICKEYLS
jgi:hypothetical protein